MWILNSQKISLGKSRVLSINIAGWILPVWLCVLWHCFLSVAMYTITNCLKGLFAYFGFRLDNVLKLFRYIKGYFLIPSLQGATASVVVSCIVKHCSSIGYADDHTKSRLWCNSAAQINADLNVYQFSHPWNIEFAPHKIFSIRDMHTFQNIH